MYLALYRKYRSNTFDEVISQEHITTTLKNQINSGKLAHAYLFTGSRGTGKTTCAKLLSRAVNCLSPVDGSPCGECEICRAIAAGCSDIIEMDAASNNGVDDVRALRDEVMYTPVLCRYKVYIIDEVHMMSVAAFNALLKTIEEPPSHVIFILATTEIHKVPATIASRCQQFRFRRIDINDSAQRLCEIAEKENASLTRPAAELISRLSDGGMRDAISLLDQCISVSKSVDENVVRDTAGVAGTEQLFSLADCILSRNTPLALKIIDELHTLSKDLILLLEEMTGHFRNLCMLNAMNMDFSLIPAGSGDKNELARQSQQFTQGEILRCIDILQEFCAKAPKTPARKTLAEMCFIRLCTPRLDSDSAALSLRLEKLEKRMDDMAASSQEMPPAFTMARSVSFPNEQESRSAVPRETPNKITTAAPPSDEKRKEAAEAKPVRKQEQEEAPPSWLFEGDDLGERSTQSEAIPEAQLPFEIDEIQEVQPPFEVDEIQEVQPPFEVDEIQEAQPPFELDEIQEAQPPFESDEPTSVMESSGDTGYGEPPPEPANAVQTIDQRLSAAGDWAEILDELPMFLQPILRQVKVRITDTAVEIYDYQPFHYDFLRAGDSIDRIKKAARKITGRQLSVLFSDEGGDSKQEESDPLTVFLENARRQGVKIKHKK